MALIIGFGLFLASVLTAALSRVVAEEFVAWNPFFVRWLIKIAVARLPENHRERFEEEWQSDVDEVPGVVGKLVRAADCSRGAYRMALTERRDFIVDRWMRTVERTNAAFSKSVMMMTAIQADTLLSPHDRDALVPRMQSAKAAIGKYERETNGCCGSPFCYEVQASRSRWVPASRWMRQSIPGPS